MASPRPAAPWSALAASRRGGYHVRNGIPNQDAHLTWTSPDGTAAVVAVADGHGDPRHSRSEIGSRLAVESAVAALSAYLDEGPRDLEQVAYDLETSVGPDLVERWQSAVADELAAHAAAGVDVLDYGSTVLAIVATDAWIAALQLGDGEIVWVSPGGTTSRPLPVDPFLDGVTTTSLCQEEPVASLRYAVAAAAEVVLAFACSDGFGIGRVDGADWWRPVGEQLWAHHRDRGTAWVRDRLAGWLVEPADVGGDDVTVAVLTR